MSFIDEMRMQFVKAAPGWLLYSPEGGGKTTFATMFPDSALVIHRDENGIGDLKAAGLVSEDYPVYVADSWEGLNKLVDAFLQSCLHKFLSFDTTNTLIQRLLFEYVNREHFQGEWKDFQNFDKGAARAMPEYETFLNKLTQLREKG